MYAKRSNRKRTNRPRRKTARRSKRNPNVIGGPQTAHVIQTLPTTPIKANQPFAVSVAGIVGDRALAHAPEYGLYRISKVVFRFKPWFDTFQSTTSGGNGVGAVPTLYWRMNRMADAPSAFSSDDLRSLGAKPIRFDDKQITVSYRPNILTLQATAGSGSGSMKMTPWLNTDRSPDTATYFPSTTEHYGHFFMVEAPAFGDGSTPVGTFDATVFYEFKNPRVTWGTASNAAQVSKVNYFAADAPASSSPSSPLPTP